MNGNFLAQEATLKQEQTISIRQMQSLELLHAPIIELQEHLSQALALNPVLEIDSPTAEITIGDPLESDEMRTPASDDSDELNDMYNVDDQWHEDLPLPSGDSWGSNDDDNEKSEYLLNSLSSEESMEDILLEELRMSNANSKIVAIAELIIGSLNERGYLKTPLADIAMATNATIEECERALKLVQSFEPPGLAARTLQESLILQLERRGEADKLIVKLIENYLEDIGRNRLPQVAKALNITLGQLDELLSRIRELNPSPGGAYVHTSSEYIIPELNVEKAIDNSYVLSGSDKTPKVHIPERYFNMLEDATISPSDKSYIREKINAARELIRALEMRGTTIQRIGKLIVAAQQEFFAEGVEQLKPMTMRQAAEELELHETTVSRAISGKYISTPRGIFALRYFFHSGYVSQAGDSVSSISVQERIRQLIEAENTFKPLSDEKIAKMLSTEGIDIARRTVAKYRDELNIPSTSLRRVHKE